MDRRLISIRKPATSSDWNKVREICCSTADSGAPIDQARWPFFGELWVGPYQKIIPDWTYVAEVDHNMIGYLTGCPDTQSLNRKKLLRFVPGLLLSLAIKKFPPNGDTRRTIRRILQLDKGPEESFPKELRLELLHQYPAHLHVNVLSGLRSSGVGKQLCHRFFSDLSHLGISGIHVYCGPGPLGFYEQLGFRELGRIEYRKGVHVYALGLRLG